MNARIDDPALDVDADVGAGAAQRRPAWAARACRSGACSRSRRSCWRRASATWSGSRDARMSGTAYGTCVLHVAPESFVGGPLALVQTGDEIALDVPSRRIDLLVSEEELAARRSLGCPENDPPRAATRSSSPTTSPRPTWAATSTSSTEPAASTSPRSTDGPPVGRRRRRRRHPRPRDRPRAAAPPPRRARVWCSSASRTSPPTRPRTTPASCTRASTTRPGSLKAPALHRGSREALRVLRRARDRLREVRQADRRARRVRGPGAGRARAPRESRTASRASPRVGGRDR